MSVRAASDFQGSANRFARDAQQKFSSFVEEQKLKEKADNAARSAQSSAKNAFDQVSDSARRAYVQLDSEYQLGDKAEKAGRRAQEVARDIDQSYSVRRKLRNFQEHVVRKYPTWKKQFAAFTSTWYGKATLFAGLLLLTSTPLFWRLVNILLLLWWLSIPLSFVALDYARRKQAEQFQEQQARNARQQNPFADLFKGRRSQPRARAGFAQSVPQQDGPIIDAEWTTLDEGDYRK